MAGKPGREVMTQMQRGFWTGLLHGGFLGALFLLLASLLLPVGAPLVIPGAASSAAVPSPEIAPAPSAAVTPSASGNEQPSIAAVDLPVGSEFARGGDVAPVLPAPMASRSDRLSQSEAPAVVAPAAEPAPIALADPMARPVASSTDGGLSPATLPGAEESPAIRRPQQITPPTLASLPGFAEQSMPDRAAVPPPLAVEAPASGPLTVQAPPATTAPVPSLPVPAAPQPVVAATTPAIAPEPTSVAPAMPSPALDLSLPPDLSDLRVLERN